MCALYAELRRAHHAERHCQAPLYHHGRGRVAAVVPLAADIDDWAIRKLGGKNWNRLHKLVYVAAVAESFTTGGR